MATMTEENTYLAWQAAQKQALFEEYERAAEAVLRGTASLPQYAWRLGLDLGYQRSRLLPRLSVAVARERLQVLPANQDWVLTALERIAAYPPGRPLPEELEQTVEEASLVALSRSRQARYPHEPESDSDPLSSCFCSATSPAKPCAVGPGAARTANRSSPRTSSKPPATTASAHRMPTTSWQSPTDSSTT